MKRKYPVIYAAAALTMAGLILDSRQTALSASQGLELCIRTAIPSLFPFFVLAGILVPGISRIRIPLLGIILKLPQGWESIFLLSCVGGYPIGAQCIAQGYQSGQLSQDQARRMIGLCNHCGPSFLFGVVAQFLPSPIHAVIVMISGILGAVLVGALWPSEEIQTTHSPKLRTVSIPQAVKQAIHSMANVCAWIILGKILVNLLDRILFGVLPREFAPVLGGMLELTNGCFVLENISHPELRVIIASFMCAFGGLCVAMQVQSICNEAQLSSRSYLPQKMTQGLFAGIISAAILTNSLYLIGVLLAGFWILSKTTVAFRKNIMYNGVRKGGYFHAVSEKN